MCPKMVKVDTYQNVGRFAQNFIKWWKCTYLCLHCVRIDIAIFFRFKRREKNTRCCRGNERTHFLIENESQLKLVSDVAIDSMIIVIYGIFSSGGVSCVRIVYVV